VANITDQQEGAAFTAQEYGQTAPFPGNPRHPVGQPVANAVVINDAAGTGLTLDGSGAYRAAGQFGVHLAVSPPAGITVNVDVMASVNAGTVVSVSPASLAFTSGNFGSDQLITLTAIGRGQAGVKAHIRGGGGVDADILVIG
jgi:hypothetical protein